MDAIEDGLTTQPEPSLRDTLASAFAEHVDSSATPPEPTTSKPTDGSEAAVVETAEQKAGRTANRLRDEQGRLLPGKKEAAAQPSTAIVPPATAISPAAPAWKPKWKAGTLPVFEKLASGQNITPDEVKQIAGEIERRERDFASGISTYKQEWDSAKPLLDAIAPFQADLQQHNIAPADMVSRLFNAHKQLVMGQPQDKLAMFQRLAREYGVPAQLAVQDAQGQWQLLPQHQQQFQQQPAQQQISPEQMQKMIDAGVQRTLQGERTIQAVAEFERNAPEHYEAVKQDMAGLLQAGLADDLQSAYDAALRLPKHNDIFQAMQQQQRADDEAKLAAERKATVTRARSNAVSVRSSTPSGTAATAGDKGLRETIAEQVRAIGAGRV